MAHGITRGIFHGGVHGAKHGGASTLGTQATKDAASGIYVPANAAEWASVMSAAGISSGGPSLLWSLQETSGNVADSIGAFTGAASGTLTYSSAVAGWTRVGIKTTSGFAGIVVNSSASLPDISSASFTAVLYVALGGNPATTRSIIQMGPTFATRGALEHPTTDVLRVFDTSNQAATGTLSIANTVKPLVLRVNRTTSLVTGYTNSEKLSPIWDATIAGKGIQIGGDNIQTWFPGSDTFMYFAGFFNTAAEMTDAQIKTLLQTLGWTVTWS